jgi:hypothetical protein
MAERELRYLDFEAGELKPFETGDSISLSVVQLPIGYVVSNTTNTDPATELGYGNWDAIGTQTIGAVTVYYFENVAV